MKKLNLYYLSLLLFFLVAIMQYIDKDEHSFPVVFFCLGICYLLLGSAQNKEN
ncbi:MAG: hypothetical protein MR457_03080 [Solobacterium sp.]|nr:hypothetical protein [Solobacterium sp.]